jgi:hypothetical protein
MELLQNGERFFQIAIFGFNFQLVLLYFEIFCQLLFLTYNFW